MRPRQRGTDAEGQEGSSLAVRSDLALGEQVTAWGASWLDRQLVAREPLALGAGFGAMSPQPWPRGAKC